MEHLDIMFLMKRLRSWWCDNVCTSPNPDQLDHRCLTERVEWRTGGIFTRDGCLYDVLM